jgi:nascent polypeptide-associated complex subunit alpha
MIPNINPRQMQQAMKRMGIQQENIDAYEVIIKCKDENIIIKNPSVQKINMAGQKSFQVSGEEEIESLEITDDETMVEITDDDINTVVEQAGISKDEAKKALEDASGDIAQAIMKYKSE